jgi:hypothetical protein
MLKVDINQEKQITFEVQIGGTQYDQMESYFNISVNGIGYSFPAKVKRDTITVDLPPLNTIIGAKLHEGHEADVKLEVIANGHYIVAWKDRATFLDPFIIEAKIKDGEITPTLKTRIIDKNADAQIMIEEESKEEENEDVEEGSKVREDEEKTEENNRQTEEVEKLVDKTISKFKPRTKEAHRSMTLAEFKKNITKEDVLRYIGKKGTKNPEIQDIIYKQASSVAKKDIPAYILKEVYNILKREY